MGLMHRPNCRCGCNNISPDVETIYYPTKRVVKTNTTNKTIRRIHPTEIVNVNRTIIRNENFYPVTESEVNETITQNYNCGTDVNNPNCRRT